MYSNRVWPSLVHTECTISLFSNKARCGQNRALADLADYFFTLSSLGDYAEVGVIKKEVDRAIHEAGMRGDGFRIIPIVLAQHGGSDDRVPDVLRTLVWKTEDDVEIVPTILRALPATVQRLVRYAPPK